MSENISMWKDSRALRIRRWLWIVIGVLVVLTLGLLGLLAGLLLSGRNGSSGGGIGYPYAMLMANPYVYRRGWRNKVVIAIVAISSFMLGLAPTVFGDTSVDYSVYEKRGLGSMNILPRY
jgi:hypothetical protein